jgi:hypothetical protein
VYINQKVGYNRGKQSKARKPDMQAITTSQEFEQAVAAIVGSKFPVQTQQIVGGWEIDILQLQVGINRETSEGALEWLRDVMANLPVLLEVRGELVNLGVALFEGSYYTVNRDDFTHSWIQYGELIGIERETANAFLEEEYGCSLA